MVRQKFTWIDSTTGKKYKDISTTPKFVDLLENVIEEEEQAESFFEAYQKVSDHAEHNIGYLIGLIKDSDVREDAFDLFLVDPQTVPQFLLNKEFAFSVSRRNG